MDTPNAMTTMEPKSLEILMAQETEKRATLQKFISNHLVDGTDYGVIKIGGRDSKPCLFKPGSEKFCSLLQLRAEFSKDEETISMLSDAKDTLAYVCRLIHNGTGQVIAEGRGACALKEKQGSVNTTIKIAEKRAQIDAVLRLGFSDSFTQDLEDMPEEEKSPVKLVDQRDEPHYRSDDTTYSGQVDPTDAPHYDNICPQCHVGHLREKTGKFGPFTSCDQYPACKYIQK